MSFWQLKAHDFHLTVTEIVYNEEKRSIEITIHLFTEDLETALGRWRDEKLNIGTDSEDPEADELIKDYLESKMQIKINGEEKEMTYLGKEAGYHDMYCFLEISNIELIENIEITSRLLMEAFEDQENKILFNIGDWEQSMIFNRMNHTGIAKPN